MRLLLSLLLFSLTLSSQTSHLLKGKVIDASDQTGSGLPGAIIKVKSTNTTTVSNIDGFFEISVPDLPDTLITYLTSYKNDTIYLSGIDTVVTIHLTNAVNLKEVEVKYKTTGNEISMLNTMKLETMNERSLMKAACCNLSESFETNPSVDVNFSDAVTGAKQIQMLGLAGQYAQITRENMPFLRGLASSYGLSFIPGTWIKSIQLGKGAGSVVNGYESFTGQINTELQPPENTDRLHLNVYANENARNEYNLNLSQKLSPQLTTALLSHVSFNPLAEDKNNDGFMDIPTGRQYNFANKYALFTKKGFEWQFGGSFLNDERIGGQAATFGINTDTVPLYAIALRNQKWDVFSKSGYVFKRPSTSMGLQLSYLNHNLDNNYASANYHAGQQTTYANFIFESYIGNTNHKYKIGASFMNDIFDEKYKNLLFTRNESAYGVFGEYILNLTDDFNMIAGSRLDYNNYYGWIYTPRLHLRYAFNKDKSVLRASGGRALRTANIFAENLSYMATSRSWHILQNDFDLPYGLLPETGWNYGVNFTQKFNMNYREAFITIDIYRTDFINQVVVDADESPQWLLIYNLNGPSFSNTGQIEFGWEIRKRLFVRTAYRYVDNMQTFISGTKEKPFVSKHRSFINLAYETKNEHWQFDFTTQYNGSKRLPGTESNPAEFQLDKRSPDYFNLLGQITYLTKIKKEYDLHIYLGVENLLDYKQLHPVIASDAPYSKYFDAAMVWGPIYGRMLYAGLRFKIK